MAQITIDGRPIVAEKGRSLLHIAREHGIVIPSMCDNGEPDHFTSCMICLVKEQASGKLLASCSVKAVDGMQIITRDEEIEEARKTALELLLSEHSGDCEAPCRIACPAYMNIPLMNRLIANRQIEEALHVVMQDIALPGVLGRICPAPCEGACKRKPIDEAVSICLLKRFVADSANTPAIPQQVKKKRSAKKVAIIGSGPAGLAAAFYLQRKHIPAVVFDRNENAGGALRYAIPENILDKRVLEKEIDHIRKAGVDFRQNNSIDAARFKELCEEFDAVVVATGNYTSDLDSWALENNGKQLIVNKRTWQTNIDHVFAIGNVNRSVQLAIRSLAQGKEVAVSIQQLFSGQQVTGEQRPFNSTLGRLLEEEFGEYMKEGSGAKRQEPEKETGKGFDVEQASIEASRCLHCDCRKPDNCKLRNYATEYQASKKRFLTGSRKPVKKYLQHSQLVYEPGKCIKCGICVRLTAKHKEKFGMTFIGRGFDCVVGVPFDEEIEKALTDTAEKVAAACPTGALAAK